MGSLQADADGIWHSPIPGACAQGYRLCRNYAYDNVCNWALPATDPNALCRSCRLTRVIPDLSVPGNKEAWYKLEVAKRRMLYSLLSLRLPAASKVEDPKQGLAFEFLADIPDAPVLTGHDNGVITINAVEADDAQREHRRMQLHEPYRTLLGHFRHEIGHYYWERLIDGTARLQSFRALFGDERADYGQALQRHYDTGAPADWQQRFVSTYASSHPWEDWAETWAHYLHMTDTLETAAACGVSLQPRRADEPSLQAATLRSRSNTFENIVDAWFPLTYMLNNLNRGLGLADSYPFVLSQSALDKIRFVHDTVEEARSA